jgi:hypothetical protein
MLGRRVDGALVSAELSQSLLSVNQFPQAGDVKQALLTFLWVE